MHPYKSFHFQKLPPVAKKLYQQVKGQRKLITVYQNQLQQNLIALLWHLMLLEPTIYPWCTQSVGIVFTWEKQIVKHAVMKYVIWKSDWDKYKLTHFWFWMLFLWNMKFKFKPWKDNIKYYPWIKNYKRKFHAFILWTMCKDNACHNISFDILWNHLNWWGQFSLIEYFIKIFWEVILWIHFYDSKTNIQNSLRIEIPGWWVPMKSTKNEPTNILMISQ